MNSSHINDSIIEAKTNTCPVRRDDQESDITTIVCPYFFPSPFHDLHTSSMTGSVQCLSYLVHRCHNSASSFHSDEVKEALDTDHYTGWIPASCVGRSYHLRKAKEAFLGPDIHHPRVVVVVARVDSEVEAQERGQLQLLTKSLVVVDSQTSRTIHLSLVAMVEAVVQMSAVAHGCQATVSIPMPIRLSWR